MAAPEQSEKGDTINYETPGQREPLDWSVVRWIVITLVVVTLSSMAVMYLYFGRALNRLMDD